MVSRIKYERRSDVNNEYCTPLYVLLGEIVYGYVTPSTYGVKYLRGDIIYHNTCDNLRQGKSKLKKKLVELGVVFYEEVRSGRSTP